ncbi:MAG: TOMM precursor leader peptide-binding protein [Spirulina sp.]
MKTLKIKPHFRVEIIEPKQVYLLAENATHALTGEFYCHLIPRLNGKNTIAAICQQLADWGTPEQITEIVDRLQAKGYITEAVPEFPEAVEAFWSLLGVEPHIAYQALQETTVYLTALANLDIQLLAANLAAVGIRTRSWHGKPEEFPLQSLLVVLTDDYLQPELAQINQIAIAHKKPWLLAKPVGGLLWFGPWFQPGQTGCWQCLAHRLRGNREVEAFVLKQQVLKNQELSVKSIEQKLGEETRCLPTSNACLPSTQQAAMGLLTNEIAKAIACQNRDRFQSENEHSLTLKGKVITLNQTNLATETHYLFHRPQCPVCGDPGLMSQQGFQPIILNSRKKQFTHDGGHRAVSPEQTLKRYEHLISPITGVVNTLIRASDPNHSLVHNYHAVHGYGSAVTDLNRLRRILGHKSGGKGKTDHQAKASGFCEAIERYSQIFHGDEPRISSTFDDLENKAIHPHRIIHFSEKQYANRSTLNQESLSHNWIPLPFDNRWEIEWTPIWSLVEQTHKYLPTAFCYYNYTLPREREFFYADSNGNAAGNTLEEAILQGLMELIERDSVAIWWYNSLPRPGVDLASFDDPYLLDLQEFYRRKNRDLWVLDISTDLEIPAFAALSARRDRQQERIIAGFGAHLDPHIAILRAVTEMNQLGSYIDDVDSARAGAVEVWIKHNLNRQTHPYLAPAPQLSLKCCEDYQQRWSDDIYEDVRTCVDIVKTAGMETFVLDQTRPDIGLNAVKVIVPELRHFWRRLAPGRLYDVPLKMGLFSEPLKEEELNPIPMIL